MLISKNGRETMSRYVAEYNVNKSDDLIKFIAEDFLTKEGFQQTVYKG